MNRKFLAAVSAAVFPFVGAMYWTGKSVIAEANSAPPYWEGMDASGAIVRGENCPVVVEKERLDLNIKSLPRGGELELNAYSAEAIAEYTFYNPTDLNVDMTLLFPFGAFPGYVPEGANDEVSAVTVDGVRRECAVRYSYSSYDFDTDRDMARVQDEKKTDGFYREDMPVTEYCVSLASGADDASMKVKLCYNAKKTRVLFSSESYTRLVISGGDMYAYTPLIDAGEKSAVFYAAGEPVGEVVPYLYIEDEAVAVQYSVTEKQMTFSDLALSGRDKTSDVSETDWYNAFVDMLNERSERGGSVDCFSLETKNLMRWYEYSMNIPAGGRAKNRVRAPLYPTVDGRGNSRYEYSYLLSPAGKWADFKEISIYINTPYYLSNGSLDFTRTDGADGEGFVYTFTKNSLPQGELTFVLTEKNEAQSDFNIFGKNFLMPSLTWAFITLLALAVVAAVITVIVVVSLRKKKKK